MMQTFNEWMYDQGRDHPQAALTTDLIEVKAEALYRVIYLMERGGAKNDRVQAIASLRSWLGAANQ